MFVLVSVMMSNSNNLLFFYFIVQFPHLLRVSTTCHSVAVRWKKKPPKWRDPADISWAAPLLEKLKQREQSSGNDAERPPAMLHMVTRVRQLGGRPYWEKDTMKCLGLDKVKVILCVHVDTSVTCLCWEGGGEEEWGRMACTRRLLLLLFYFLK